MKVAIYLHSDCTGKSFDKLTLSRCKLHFHFCWQSRQPSVEKIIHLCRGPGDHCSQRSSRQQLGAGLGKTINIYLFAPPALPSESPHCIILSHISLRTDSVKCKKMVVYKIFVARRIELFFLSKTSNLQRFYDQIF